MNGPLLLLGWDVGVGLAFLVFARLRERWTRWAPLAALFAAAALWVLPFDAPASVLGIAWKLQASWVVFGRAFVLEPGNRPGIALLHVAAGILIACAGARRPGRSYAASAWVFLGFLSAALMIRPFLFAAVLLELAALAAAILLKEEDSSTQEVSMRLISVVTPAMLVMLLAGWLVDTAGVTTATPDLAREATFLLLVGLAILLAVPPFHLWVTTPSTTLHSEARVWVLCLMQTTGLLLALRFLETYDWLRSAGLIYSAARVAGLLALAVGAAAALADGASRRATLYAMISDSGAVLLALGLPDGEGVPLAVALAAVRILGLALAASGWGVEPEEDLAGWQAPSFAGLYGRLTLAGFPLTAAFPLRVFLLAKLAPVDALGAAVLLISSVGLTLAAGRSLRAAIPRWRQSGIGRMPVAHSAAILLCAWMALAPKPWMATVASISAGLVNLVR